MKSVKPGRGPSLMGGVMSIVMGLFGVVWTVVVLRMGAGFMAVFGILFIIAAIVQGIYHLRNATGKKRYSAFDITDGDEEVDPLEERFGAQRPQRGADAGDAPTNFCPYCGASAQGDYAYCRSCGKKMP